VNAIILAAGLGSRIASLTGGRPKCLLPLHGRTILEWQLALLERSGIDRVTVVVGHDEAAIRAVALDRVSYATYPHYARTNNLYTLQFCGHLLEGPVVVLFADVLVAADAFARCATGAADAALLVDTGQRRADTMRVRLANGRVEDIGAHVPVSAADGNFIGVAKFSARGSGCLRAELNRMVAESGFDHAYYTQALPRLAAAGQAIEIVPVAAAGWCEIDTEDDYRRARDGSFYVIR
jgi:choline kinase